MRAMSAETDVKTWLAEFQTAVRARDFATGRRMFAADAVAFGTWARAVSGLDNIEREQWRNVWPRISDFTFEATPVIRAAADTAWIAASWWSGATGPDGAPLRREGRATFILARQEGRWVAAHSHVSLLPTQSESAHGRL